MRDVTAIIKTFLRDDCLFDCVESLRKQYPDMPVIVADDGRESVERENRLEALGVERYIQLPFDSGLCAGRNAMLSHVSTPYFLLGDDDFYYSHNAKLENLRSLMEVADIAGGTLLQNGILRNYECNFVPLPDGAMWYQEIERAYALHRDVRYTPSDLTLNFFIGKTDRVRAMGGWDENIKISFEHEDFFLMVKKAGLKVVYCPDAFAYHRVGTPDSDEYRKYRFRRADYAYFFKKWGFPYVQDCKKRRLYPTGEVDCAIAEWPRVSFGPINRRKPSE